jgi:hypothetical protein
VTDSKLPAPIIDLEGFTLAEAQARTVALEKLLRDHGVVLRSGVPLEAIALSVFEALYKHQTPLADDRDDIRITFKHLIGLNELAGLILSVRDHPDFGKLIPHLHLLNEGVSIQNMPAPVVDQATNKVFELFAAILALHCGRDLELDDAAANGRNPDVLFTVQGRRWGIACKVLHANNPEGFITHLNKGIDQIEKSPAEVGIVLFAIKDLIDQEKFWSITNPIEAARGDAPYFSAFRDKQEPFRLLLNDAKQVGDALAGYLPAGYLQAAFHGKKSLPGFLVWAHVASAIVHDAHPVPTSVRAMTLQPLATIQPDDRAVLECLHQAAYAADKVQTSRPAT